MIQDAPDPSQRWMQNALREELVSRSHNFSVTGPSDCVIEICINGDR